MDISEFYQKELKSWLSEALRNAAILDKATQDEAPHLAIARMERQSYRDSDRIRAAMLELLNELCYDESIDLDYALELVALASSLKDKDAVQLLARIALLFPEFLIPERIRFAILAALINSPPPQSSEFWCAIFEQDRSAYSLFVLSGLLLVAPGDGVDLLPLMPDGANIGRSVVLKLDLAWDEMVRRSQPLFFKKIEETLSRCNPFMQKYLTSWLSAKASLISHQPNENKGLIRALKISMGSDSVPKRTRAKLACSELVLC